MNTENFFPNDSDLETLIQDGNYKKIQSLMRNEGVFYLGKKNTAHEYISRFAFGKKIYDRAFGTLVKATFGLSMSGMRAIVYKPMDLKEKLDEQIDVVLDHKYSPKIIQVYPSESIIKVKIEYTKINPKLAAFSRKEVHHVEFDVESNSDNLEFRALPKDSVDSLVVRDVIMNFIDKIGGKSIATDIVELPIANRVELFDEIIDNSDYSDWKIDEVCGMAIRAGGDGDEKDGLEEELSEDDIRILQSAILEGSHLRKHKIVEDLIVEGYYFSSMTFWTHNAGRDGSLDQYKVKIDFKKRPQILVITVSSYRSPDTQNDRRWFYNDIPSSAGKNCNLYFWNLVNKKFDNIKEKVSEASVSVNRADSG